MRFAHQIVQRQRYIFGRETEKCTKHINRTRDRDRQRERRLRARTAVVNNRTLRLKGKNPATGVCVYFFAFPHPAPTCVSRARSRWRIQPLVHDGRRRCVFKFTRTAALERRRDRADRTWYRRRGRRCRWADTTWVRRAYSPACACE